MEIRPSKTFVLKVYSFFSPLSMGCAKVNQDSLNNSLLKPGNHGTVDPMQQPRRILYLFIILLGSISSLSLAAGDHDFFSIAGAGTNSVIYYQPGERFQTVISLQGLEVRQSRGSVTWNFRYYINGHLSYITETESYSTYIDGDRWSFQRDKSFTIASTALRGKHRIAIFLKDNSSGLIYHDEIEFSVQGRPYERSSSQEAAVQSFKSASDASRTVWFKDVSVLLSAVFPQENKLYLQFILHCYDEERWFGFEDAYLVDGKGRRHEAIVGGTIKGNGWGGVDLVPGIPLKGEIHFDSYASGIDHIDVLEVQFHQGLVGRWGDIPVPFQPTP
jgi:hypothetical protein